jgi:hypothetical protein
MRFSREIAFAFVLNLPAAEGIQGEARPRRELESYGAEPAGAPCDVTGFGEFDIWATIPQSINSQSRESDEVFFRSSRGLNDRQHRVSYLFYDYGAA